MKRGDRTMRILDLSHWNSVTNWNDVAKSCDGVILKCGGNDTKSGRAYQDKMFEHYYECAKTVGLPVGAYYFAKGETTAKGIEQAIFCKEILNSKVFELPIYCDYEQGDKKTRTENTNFVYAFCNTLEKYGYFVGIYGSDTNTFKEMLNKDRLTRFTWWVARYGKKPQYAIDKNNFKMWQKTSTGKVSGINGNVDISECYADFPTLIKGVHKNGY